VGAADEVALRTARPQGIRQRQAAHDMAAAHVQGCVGAEGDFHDWQNLMYNELHRIDGRFFIPLLDFFNFLV